MNRPLNKDLEVVCGIIIEGKKVLAAQRSLYMSLPLKWEFPGGKKIKGETDEECLERELLEELNLQVEVRETFATSEHLYGETNICLKAYVVVVVGGTLFTYEHSQVAWLTKDKLLSLQWAPADLPIVHKLIDSDIL